MYIGLHVNYPWFLSDFNETLIFWTHLWKILKYKIYEANSRFLQFCKRTWKWDLWTEIVGANGGWNWLQIMHNGEV